MSSPTSQVLDRVKALLDESVATGALAGRFKDVTRAEYPYCRDFPALHVNATGVTETSGVPGMGLKLRRVRVALTITLSQADLESQAAILDDLAYDVGRVIEADRYLGGLLAEAITELAESPVTSPLGSAYAGVRRVEFTASVQLSLL